MPATEELRELFRKLEQITRERDAYRRALNQVAEVSTARTIPHKIAAAALKAYSREQPAA